MDSDRFDRLSRSLSATLTRRTSLGLATLLGLAPVVGTEAKKRKTHTVKPKRLKIDVTLDGAFVAREMKEVALRPEAWTDYEIVEAVEHGEKVREGETLIKFDDEDIKEAIADLELDQRLNELSIRRDEEELPRMEKTLAMNLEEAERNDKEAPRRGRGTAV